MRQENNLRRPTSLALAALLALSACGGGGAASAVLGAPPPPLPPGSTVPVIGGLTLYGGAGGQAPHSVHVQANVDASAWVASIAYAVGDYVGSADGSTVYRCSRAHTSSATT